MQAATATATPQRAGTTATKDSTPSSGGGTIPHAPWATASPQTPTTFAYTGPARASSSVLPSPPKDDSPQSRSRWTEHLESTIVEDEAADGEAEEEEDQTATVGLPLPPAAAASLARMQRSSLPMPFELTDPADHEHDQDDTIRPGLGRAATTRSVRIMQPPPEAPSPAHLQVPRQSYMAPESRGTTPMPMRPTSQLGLVTYGGRVRSPRFNAPGFDLKLTREPGIWARVQWRIGLPLLVFGPVVIQLFFDFCAVYTVVQAAAEPTFGATSARRNWSLAAAAYAACVLIWVVGVIIIYEAAYCFWRRWRVKRPLITPIYLSTPARHLASMASFDVYCFFRYVRRTAWDADAHDYVYDDRVMGREGAEGRAGNRSKEMLGGHSRERSSEMWTGGHSREISGGQSSDMFGKERDHRRSDSGGMLMQPRDSEDWGRVSALGGAGGRESGMRRRSVGKTGGDEVRASLQLNTTSDPSPTSPNAESTPTSGNGKGHKRTASGQTRFQELVHGPPVEKKNGNFAHRRSMSGRTSSEVERQLEISPLESRRVSGSSGSSAAVGRVVSWVRAFGHGQHVHPSTAVAQSEKREAQPDDSYSTTSGQWTTDGLAEWFYARTQGAPTVATLIPRAGIAAAALFAFWEPQVGAGRGATIRDGAFFRSNGTLTGFARGVLLANVAWVLVRSLIVLASLLGLWILSGQMCAGMCGPRYRWEEPLDEGEWDGEKDEAWGEPRDKLNWEWRIAARRRVQDAYELCMVRRRSATTTTWRAPPAPPSQPPTPAPRIEGVGKGKGRETPRPGMDTFGSTFGAGVVKERNSDQELALSGLRDEGLVPVVEVTQHGSSGNGSNGSRRGMLTADTFTAPGSGTGLVPPTTVAPLVSLVPPLTPSATTSVLPFPLHPSVLPSPLVTAVRKGSEPSTGRLTPPTMTAGSRTTPSAPGTGSGPGTSVGGSGPGTSVSGSTPRGPSTSTLVPMLTPRAGAVRLESVSASSRAGESVLESEEEGEEGETSFVQSGEHSFGHSAEHSFGHSGEHSFGHSGEHSFGHSGEHPFGHSGEHSFSHSDLGDRSRDSYAEHISIDDYAHSQDGNESVRIRAPDPAGSEVDTSGSYSEGGEVDTSASLSSLGQPISSRFFPITRPGDLSSGSGGQRGSGSGSGGGGMSNMESPVSPVSSNNRSSGQGAGTGSGSQRQRSLLSHDDSILSHNNRDSIISHVPRTPTSTVSRAQDSIVSRVRDDSIISSPSQSVRSGLIPPPPPNPNRRRRMTSPSAASSSVDSFGVIRQRVGSHPFGPAEFGPPVSDVEGFEAEQEDSVGMLSTTSSRKNSLAAVSQRGGRRGRVSSGSQSGSQSGSGSARSRAVSANYSVSVSGSGSGSGGSVRRRSQSVHEEGEERDYTLGHRPMWRQGSGQLQSGEATPAMPGQFEPPVAGPSRQPRDDSQRGAEPEPEPEQR
ncbi:hypothetical protein FRC12_018844 [Ceratobasidium sp. 428]|nr:hypothetical protein FRC12_018844 [Ceratobasidium sp. 428]